MSNLSKNSALPIKGGKSESSIITLTGILNLYFSWPFPNSRIIFVSTAGTFPPIPNACSIFLFLKSKLSNSAILFGIAEISAPESISALKLYRLPFPDKVIGIEGLFALVQLDLGTSLYLKLKTILKYHSFFRRNSN
jgi:hypothetical protein